MRDGAPSLAALLLAVFCYGVFVVYGSLIPFDYHMRDLNETWRSFQDLRYLTFDVRGRADWVANILLYVPLAFLLSALMGGADRNVLLRVLRWAIVVAGCVMLAVAIEFIQLYFPPRTVSLNDLVAECIGVLIGIAIWELRGRRILHLLGSLRSGGSGAIRAALVIYALGYLLISLFPYDFLVSIDEFMDKLQSDRYALFLVQSSCGRPIGCAGKLLMEALAVVPLGFLLSLPIGRSRAAGYVVALVAGAALGILIEGAQLFVHSGISQGISVVTRAAGMLFGVVLYQAQAREFLLAHCGLIRPVLLLGALPYIAVVAWANGWLRGSWLGVNQALGNLAQVRWMPFYYHYYTAETAAAVSVMVYAAMYAPLGVAWWAWEFARKRTEGRGTIFVAVLTALFSMTMEIGKLFSPGKRPDITDILIGVVAAVFAYKVAAYLYQWGSSGHAQRAGSRRGQ